MRLAPIGWALVVVTCAFAVLSAVVFLTTGEFATGWLLASTIVYSAVGLCALGLAMLDRAPALATATAAPAGPPADAQLVSREVIYATKAGEAVRLAYRWPDGSTEHRLVAMTTGEIVTHGEIETYVDALPSGDEPADLDEAVEDALTRASLRGM